nr:hypothetical protein [uncultured Cohaesibacter sp.]
MILAPKRHERQLWADLLKNCGIEHPLSMSDIEQATSIVSAGQADIVFVDESYGPLDIANILIPARQVEFAGGRGVCLILCSKKATTQDVLNARKLGFASLVILPASIDTVRKHLELAARYIPLSDEELGWSKPRIKEAGKATKSAIKRDLPASDDVTPGEKNTAAASPMSGALEAGQKAMNGAPTEDWASSSPTIVSSPTSAEAAEKHGSSSTDNAAAKDIGKKPIASPSKSQAMQPPSPVQSEQAAASESDAFKHDNTQFEEDDFSSLIAPGRSGRSADEEVVFL